MTPHVKHNKNSCEDAVELWAALSENSKKNKKIACVYCFIVVEVAKAGVKARTIVEASFGMIVCGLRGGASCHFFQVAKPVIIKVEETVSGAVVVWFREFAGTVILCGQWVVIACKRIGASGNLEFIASAISIKIVEAITQAVEIRLCIFTGAIICPSLGIKVARCIVGASFGNFGYVKLLDLFCGEGPAP